MMPHQSLIKHQFSCFYWTCLRKPKSLLLSTGVNRNRDSVLIVKYPLEKDGKFEITGGWTLFITVGWGLNYLPSRGEEKLLWHARTIALDFTTPNQSHHLQGNFNSPLRGSSEAMWAPWEFGLPGFSFCNCGKRSISFYLELKWVWSLWLIVLASLWTRKRQRKEGIILFSEGLCFRKASRMYVWLISFCGWGIRVLKHFRVLLKPVSCVWSQKDPNQPEWLCGPYASAFP